MRRLHLLTIALLLAITAAACSNHPPGRANYAADVAAARAAKDAWLKSDKESPVPAGKREEILPLAYFPIDASYDVPAALKPATDRSVFEMATSTGGHEQMRRAGTLEFTLKGQQLKLSAFIPAGERDGGRLFVPFSDMTSGEESYHGGRFIDLDRTPTGMYELDFNRAYHPTCVYNPTYECPIPPQENRLDVPVQAGERLKEKGKS